MNRHANWSTPAGNTCCCRHDPRPRNLLAALALAFAVWSAGLAAAQGSAPGGATVVVPAVFIVEPDKSTPLAIHLTPESAIPTQSFIRITGLPESTKLSAGHQVSPGSWAVALKALPALQLNAPLAAAGNSDLVISLVNVDGQVLARQVARLVVAPAWLVTPNDPRRQADATDLARSAIPTVSADAGGLSAGTGAAQPPPEPRVVISPAQEARAIKLVEQGTRYLEISNIAVARQFFRTAAELNYAPAALLLARTFDPDAIAEMSAPGLSPDIGEAIRWYRLARTLGASEAAPPLSRLTAR